MLAVNDLRKGEVFKEDGQPYLVLKYQHVKMGRGNAVIKVKARNLKNQAVVEKSFLSGSSVAEADVQKVKVQYLYQRGGRYYFMESSTFETVELSQDFLGEASFYLKEGNAYQILTFENQPVSLELPLKVSLKVTETGSGFKGDSVANVMKPAKLETGLQTLVPNFIEDGETVKIDTRTGQYLGRA